MYVLLYNNSTNIYIYAYIKVVEGGGGTEDTTGR